jgi:3-oxoacyl-(acyl-carrier-protein) synthase
VILGTGAVSPAGWGVAPLLTAMKEQRPAPAGPLARPGWTEPLQVRRVPAPETKPAFLGHPRLRRTSPITPFAVAAALEALGADAAAVTTGALRLGIVFCTMTGSVNYSRRFYDETLRDAATASPLVFPETVFNAPASHLAAVLGATGMNYTLVGDPGVFLQGLALAADWLESGAADGALVVAAEEMDWVTGDAWRVVSARLVAGEGAGALYLGRGAAGQTGVRPAMLAAVTDSHLFWNRSSRRQAAVRMAAQLGVAPPSTLLCDGAQDDPRLDAAEAFAWRKWHGSRLSPRKLLGEGLTAATAWQCALAVRALEEGTADRALVSVVGCNQQAIGAAFERVS